MIKITYINRSRKTLDNVNIDLFRVKNLEKHNNVKYVSLREENEVSNKHARSCNDVSLEKLNSRFHFLLKEPNIK